MKKQKIKNCTRPKQKHKQKGCKFAYEWWRITHNTCIRTIVTIWLSSDIHVDGYNLSFSLYSLSFYFSVASAEKVEIKLDARELCNTHTQTHIHVVCVCAFMTTRAISCQHEIYLLDHSKSIWFVEFSMCLNNFPCSRSRLGHHHHHIYEKHWHWKSTSAPNKCTDVSNFVLPLISNWELLAAVVEDETMKIVRK